MVLKSFDKRVEEIRNCIGEYKNPLMFFDVDTDGSTSYLQLKRVFKKIKGYPLDKDIKKQKKLIEKNIYDFDKVDLVIIFDLPFLTEDFLNLLKGKKIIWVDHHPTNDADLIEKYDILHLNPLSYDEHDNRPSCFMAYLIADSLDNLDLIALGSVSDFFLLDVIEDLYGYDKHKFKLIFKLDDEKREEIFSFIRKYKFNDSRVRVRREDYIRFLSYEAGVGVLKNFFDFICKMERQEDSVKAFRIIEKLSFEDLVSEIGASKSFPFIEYSQVMVEYKKRLNIALSEEQNDFFFYDYVGKISFAKTLSEELNYRFTKSRVVCVCFKKPGKDWYSCSLRGKGVVVNEIVSHSLSNLNGRGGGHPFAAGVSISKDDFFKFKKRLFDGFDNLLNK